MKVLTPEQIVFYIFSLWALISAFTVLFLRRADHGVYAFISTFVSVSLLIGTLNAYFLAALQLIVYIGIGVVFLSFSFLFHKERDGLQVLTKKVWFVRSLAFVLMFSAGIFILKYLPFTHKMSEEKLGEVGQAFSAFSIKLGQLATFLFTRYLLGIEVIGLLILATTVGIILVLREEKG